MFHHLTAATLLLLAATGCSSTPGSALGLIPQPRHPLTPDAKALSAANKAPAPLPRELDKHVGPRYTVEPGDALLVQPADLDSPIRFPGDQPVLPDGTINLGRFGLLVVAGRTIPEVEAAVRAQIDAYLKDPHTPKETRNTGDAKDPPTEVGPITVRVVTRVSKVYYVLGEVNAPGSYPLRGNETVLDAILAAGGLNDRAARKHIILTRPTPPDSCRIVLNVCLPDIVQVGDTATNYQIAAGDRIYVPSRTSSDHFFRRDHKKDQAHCDPDLNSCLVPVEPNRIP